MEKWQKSVSFCVTMEHDVLQGSALGPVVLIITINNVIFNICYINNYIQPVGYADEISIIQHNQNRNALNDKTTENNTTWE